MLKRYRTWTETYPLFDWLLTVAVGLAVFVSLFFVVPGPHKPGLALMLVVFVLSPPTHGLLRRFSEERRRTHPIPASQEQGVGLLAALLSVCGIGAFCACLLGGRWGWAMDRLGPLLMVWSVSALLSLALGEAARRTAAGRWATRLTLGWLVLLLAVMLVGVLWRAAGHV